MKTFRPFVAISAAFILFVIVMGAMAQMPGSSVSLGGPQTCATPGPGVFAMCQPTAGGPATFTNNGSAYATFNPVPGPAGPAGATGPTWSSCTGVTLTPSGVGVYTLTIVPANCH